jgi:ABC-2 type transport system permease protein
MIINPTVASITLRATLGRRRALLFAVPPLILIGLTLILRAAHPPGQDWPGQILGDFGFSVLLPLTALIIGTSVLGAEVDDGSIVHLLATPVSRLSVILTKFTVATVLTMAFTAVPELIAGLAAPTGSKLAIALFVGALAGSAVYSAIFVMASALTTRAVAVGLLYVLIWEGLLSNLIGGARILSAGHYALGIANAITPDPSLHAGLSLDTSLILGVIVSVAALWLATRRLASFGISGDAAQ